MRDGESVTREERSPHARPPGPGPDQARDPANPDPDQRPPPGLQVCPFLSCRPAIALQARAAPLQRQPPVPLQHWNVKPSEHYKPETQSGRKMRVGELRRPSFHRQMNKPPVYKSNMYKESLALRAILNWGSAILTLVWSMPSVQAHEKVDCCKALDSSSKNCRSMKMCKAPSKNPVRPHRPRDHPSAVLRPCP